jgi:hypothetical protein
VVVLVALVVLVVWVVIFGKTFMEIPFDSSDLACLVQADWHEEFGDLNFAEDIREEVESPTIHQFVYEFGGGIGVGRVGGVGGGVVSSSVGGVGGSVGVGRVGGIVGVGRVGSVGGG